MTLRNRLAALFIVATIITSMPVSSFADSGVGMQVGEPGTVGVSLRFSNTAIGAAWNFYDNGYLHVNIDQWAMREELVNPVDWFVGYGVDVGIGNDWRVAARIPVGMIYEPSNKFEIFAQIAPGLKVLPNVDFYLGAAIGARYRF
ncbi:MAG: hypothetical protein ACK5BQ_01060 [Ignavibacteria bacterium]|jgi:hypothetical protein